MTPAYQLEDSPLELQRLLRLPCPHLPRKPRPGTGNILSKVDEFVLEPQNDNFRMFVHEILSPGQFLNYLASGINISIDLITSYFVSRNGPQSPFHAKFEEFVPYFQNIDSKKVR